MFRLVEIVKAALDGKESQAYYEFNSEVDCKGEYEFKLGQAMKSDAYSTFCYFSINNEGDILDKFSYLSNPDDNILPRLFEIKFTEGNNSEGDANISKYETLREAQGNFHSKLGSAIKNNSVNKEILCIINEKGLFSDLICWVRPREESDNSEEVVEE